MDNFEAEFKSINNHTRNLLKEYVKWGPKITIADTQQLMYSELVDFVNFRMETADSCLLLSQSDRIADCLGLCRSLLENYLLFILMCRGRKTFQIRDCSHLTNGQFKVLLEEERVKVSENYTSGKSNYIAVMKHPKLTRRLIYIFEGFRGEDDPEFIVPAHYFQFQEFRPDAMRLTGRAYFEYIEHSSRFTESEREYQEELTLLYREFLSYDGLLRCLDINGLADSDDIDRIEVHYVFTGQFLHPTHGVSRNLHERSNHFDGNPAIGLRHAHLPHARLLAALYVCYLTAGILDEIVRVHENAPAKYIKDAGVSKIRELIQEVPRRFDYFWFIFNKPAPFDKYRRFQYSTPAERAQWSDWMTVPDNEPKFNKDILRHLRESFTYSQALR
ncbi:hypothetical protein [Nocardia sp. Marseille-Q1738]